MDIREVKGAQNELAYTPLEQDPSCPGCSAPIIPGDRFCQECGYRITTSRNRRAPSKSIESGARAEAEIICINCGTTNKALSKYCSDCKIPLGPVNDRREDSMKSERNGLRGSLTSNAQRPKRSFGQTAKAPLRSSETDSSSQTSGARTSAQSGTNNVAHSENVPQCDGTSRGENVPLNKGTPHSEGVPHKEATQHRASVPQTEATQHRASVPHKERTTISDNVPQSESVLSTNDVQPEEVQSPPKPVRKQRLPGFLRGQGMKSFSLDNRSSDEIALDYLYPADDDASRNAIREPFDKIDEETRKIGSIFSLSRLIVTVESLFERIPTPLLVLVIGFIIVCATVVATTEYNRYEQRMAAIDKIAANAETDMLTYQLDDAINTLQELEKTEKGDLPPRARAVLNQSLWLRSYAHAKKRDYAKAIGDLSLVTSTFISYDDVTEKLDQYKRLLAAHPEFGGQVDKIPSDTKLGKLERSLNAPSVKADAEPVSKDQKLKNSSAQSKVDTTGSRETTGNQGISKRVEAVRNAEPTKRANAARNLEAATNQDATRDEDGGRNRGRADVGATSERLTTPKGSLAEGASTKSPAASPARNDDAAQAVSADKKKKRGKSDAALIDTDMKRYSGLLVEYFSKAETSRSTGGQLAEPPSYEEWSASGKKDF